MRRLGVGYGFGRSMAARFAALTAIACIAVAAFATSAFALTGHKQGGSISVPATGGLAVNQSTQDLFVVDGSGITRVDAATQTPTSFVPGSFSALAADAKSGNVYAVHPGTDPTTDPQAVDVFDSTGAAVGPLDGSTVPAGFFNPTAVAVDPQTGDVYVANVDPTFTVSPLIEVFDSTGFKQEITPALALSSPSSMAIDGAGNLYVFDSSNVQQYSLAGAFITTIYGDFAASALGVDPVADQPYVAALNFTSFQSEVRNYDSSGKVIFTFGAGTFSSATGIAVDGTTGRVYVGDSGVAVPFYDSFDVPEPTVTTNAPTNVRISTATLNGTINPNENPTTNWHFEYGTTTAYGQSAPSSDASITSGGTSDVPVSVDLSGLEPATTYHFQLVADRGDGPQPGGDQTFTTLDSLTTLVVDPPSDVTKTSATFHGTVDNHGFNSTYFFTVKATDSPYTGTTPPVQLGPAAGPQAVTGALADLPVGSGVEVRLVATTSGGTAVSEPLGFRTQGSAFVPLPPPALDLNPYGCTAPHLNAYTTKAKPGKAITLTGSDLGVGGIVSFGASLADADTWSANAIRVVVPSDARGSAAVKVDCSRESNTIKVGIAKATAKHKAKAKKCKKGYAKKKVKGKTRCVKKAKAQKGHR